MLGFARRGSKVPDFARGGRQGTQVLPGEGGKLPGFGIDIKVVRNGFAEQEGAQLAQAVLQYPVDGSRRGDRSGTQSHGVQQEGRRQHCILPATFVTSPAAAPPRVRHDLYNTAQNPVQLVRLGPDLPRLEQHC